MRRLVQHRAALVAASCIAAAATGTTLVAGAGADAPPKPNVAVLSSAPTVDEDAPQVESTEVARQADPNRRDDADVRGVTVRSGTSSVDLITDGAIVCSGPDVGGQQGAAACSPLPLVPDAIPFQTGDGAGGAWVSAVAPDGVVAVSATGDDGGTATAKVARNVAVVAVAGAREIRSVSWVTATGERYEQTLGQPARAVR